MSEFEYGPKRYRRFGLVMLAASIATYAFLFHLNVSFSGTMRAIILGFVFPVAICGEAIITVRAFMRPSKITLTSCSLILPPSILIRPREARRQRKYALEIVIPYHEIEQIAIEPFVGNTVVLTIQHGNEQLGISSGMLATDAAFLELHDFLLEAVRQNDTEPPDRGERG